MSQMQQEINPLVLLLARLLQGRQQAGPGQHVPTPPVSPWDTLGHWGTVYGPNLPPTPPAPPPRPRLRTYPSGPLPPAYPQQPRRRV